MAEAGVRPSHHVVDEGFLKLSSVIFSVELNKDGLLDPYLEHSACIFEGLVDLVRDLKVASTTTLGLLVDDDPVFSGQVYGLLDGKPSEHLLVDMDDLVLAENLCRTKHCAFDLCWNSIELNAPV